MRRDLVLISEMIDAAEQARKLVVETSVGDLHGDRIRRDALLWNIGPEWSIPGDLARSEVYDRRLLDAAGDAGLRPRHVSR